MTEENPLVSIIIPTYNRASLLRETMDSVQQQSYQNWECIIVDDLSEDNTKEIVSEFASVDGRFIYTLNKNKKGAPGSRNTGFGISQGTFVIFLDSDDLLSQECLGKRIAFAGKDNLDFYCFATGAFNQHPFDTAMVWNYLHKPENDLVRFLQQDMPWCVYGILWSASFLKKIGPWDEALLCWQDWDMHVRALLHKNVQYRKAADKISSIDSFYRQNHSHVSIASFDTKPLHLQNRMTMLQKHMYAIADLPIKGSKLEMARLVFRTSRQAFAVTDKKNVKDFFYSSLQKLGFRHSFIFQWYGYLKYVHSNNTNKLLRKYFDITPRLYKETNLLLHSSTHLSAVYSS